MSHRPTVLIICDGFGEKPDARGNAIAQATTPILDRLTQRWPHTTIEASGEAVGLPAGQMGNSEVGHLTIGAGRVIRQPLSRQHFEIDSGSIYKNETLITAVELAKSRGTALHLLGLVSPGGVHSHQRSATAVAKLAAKLGQSRIYIHAFTDGRDTPPASAHEYLKTLERELREVGTGKIASLSGRYFAMDRDNRWDRTKAAYDALTAPTHTTHHDWAGYIADNYAVGTTDEFLPPVAIATTPGDRVRIQDGDVIIFFNFRPDRARQLTHALVDANFADFERGTVLHDLHVVTFSEYDRALEVPVAFPKEDVESTLGEVISNHNLTQFHIAETEKYAHVTYFINGGRETPFAKEDRQLIPSPQVAYYNEQPKMSADEVAIATTKRLRTHSDALIIVNFANPDMVGHTGDFKATLEAIQETDRCIGLIVNETLAQNGVALITADHGNAEEMIAHGSDTPVTSHSSNPVPLIICGTGFSHLESGGLADVAPTILMIMGLETPSSMTGHSLLR